MADQRPALPRRGRFVGWAVVYALLVAYASLVVGPRGVHIVPLDPETAWQIFKATPYLAHGSDQRADWIANLLMVVPLGFLVTGALWPRRQGRFGWLAAGAALCCCLCFVLIVKYFQLFFPPRTVSLNYIAAQSLGSLLGVACFWLGRSRLSLLLLLRGDRRRTFMILCGIYAVALLLFFLFPLDFALSADDLRARAAVLPRMLFSIPGAERSTTLGVVAALAGTAATVPLGLLFALLGQRRSLLQIAVAGALAMSAVTLLTMLVLSATPSLITILYRTTGIVIGAAALMWLTGQDPARWRNLLARLVPLMILPYVFAVLFINGLFSPHWRTVPEALAALEPLGLLPFYYHYMVPKAHAAANVAWQVLTFTPIGVMVALRYGHERAGAWTAAILAVLFSLAVEFGRWFKPGLQPDFSNAIIAAIAAAVAVKLTVDFWHMLEREPLRETTKTVPRLPDGREGIGQPIYQPQFRATDQRPPATTIPRLAVATACLAMTFAIALYYPLSPWALIAAVALYALGLWRWPSLWLAVIPAILPVLDLAPWTGWMYLGEPDPFVLVTIGILVLRAPPLRTDYVVEGLPGVVLALTLASYLLSIAVGLALPGPEGGSDNPYLRPDNALRLAKGFFIALALLPFLRERMRTRGDAMAWLGAGMAAGLALVAAATLAERVAFTGVLTFDSEYRVVATFSSMHLGGGHIGAYIVMVLPFLLVFMLKPRPLSILAMLGLVIGAGYALIVTFARTAYVAALISTFIGCSGSVWAASRRHTGTLSSLGLSALLFLVVGGIVIAAFGTYTMTARIQTVTSDLVGREGNWTGGLALRDDNLATMLFGMGLGTYPRIVLARKPEGRFPTNFVVERDGAYPFLSLRAGSPTFFEQKVPIEPDRQYRLFFALRSPDGKGGLSLFLCEKMLLYSENCRYMTFQPRTPGVWEDFGTAISTAGMTSGWLRRPVELALIDEYPGSTIEVGHIRLLDARGHNVLANGDFSRGTERWFFTDDNHLIWRIKNQYLMSFFEGGALGLVAFVLLAGAALAGAVRGMARGDRMAAAIAASLVGFLCSSVFDYLLEAPRLAALFYFVAFSGLMMLQAAPAPAAPFDRRGSIGSSLRPA